METKLVKINPDKFNNLDLCPAADILRSGGLVAFPTETVYGLGANALHEEAVARIFTAKGRPQDNPLIVHITDVSDVEKYAAEVPEAAYRLFEQYWPGPLTVVLKKLPAIPSIVSAGLDTVAIRMPSHPVAAALIKAAGLPIAAPSANTSGRPSPTCAAHVIEDMLSKVEMIIDGGDCGIGLESTVVSLCEDMPVLLRPGAVTLGSLQDVLGEVRTDKAITERLAEGTVVRSPGMKYRHYAPKAHLTVVQGDSLKVKEHILQQVKKGNTGVLCFDGEENDYDGAVVLSYGKENDPLSLAQNLFRQLRRFDETNCEKVYARCPNPDGIGLAVYNRIIKAAGFDVINVN